MTDLRQRLLDEAAVFTAENGWASLTMAKLGQRVGVSRQTVYNELGSKPALADAIVAQELAKFLAAVEEELSSTDDRVLGIQRAVSRVLTMADENVLMRAVLSSVHGANSDLLPLLTTQAQPIIDSAGDMIVARIETEHPDQPIPQDELLVAVESIVRLVMSHITAPTISTGRAAEAIAWVAASLLSELPESLSDS
ncbi:MAG: TetR family transcriptional regulator [Actinobacteria bacterium]|mgnify:CR=1 FL=1|nr:TetR family transcriptional regulator [Actinomycetota bacterium]